MYLDNVGEQLANIEKGASRPPKYVTHTPVLFDVWLQWYDDLPFPTNDPAQQDMKEMGSKNIPEEFKEDFKGLEDFYKHYTKLTEEVN